MTILETLLIICIIILLIIILLIRILLYNTNKKRILKSMLEDLWTLEEVQNKCDESIRFTKTYNNREGQIFQIKKIRNKLEKL